MKNEIRNVTVVIITNDAQAMKTAIGHKNDDWINYHEVNMSEAGHGNYMPFYHRSVIEQFITTNSTDSKGPPTTYAYFETDTVLDGLGLVAWARDTAFVRHHGGIPGVDRPCRQFWRWEWNEAKKCVAMNGEINPIQRGSENFVDVGGRRFVFLRSGRFSGIYVVTAQHMTDYYNSGMFWSRPEDSSWAREVQLYDLIHGDNTSGYAEETTDNQFVPIDEQTGTLDLRAAVHHQSDKYPRMPWPFGKLCLEDLFTDP